MSINLHYTAGDEVSRALATADPALGALIDRIGVVDFTVREDDPFKILVRSVVSQQISDKAAEAIWRRFIAGPGRTPDALAVATDEELRGVGLSAQKASYVRGIAEAVVSGEIDLAALRTAPDEEVIEILTRLRGVGRWTAEMFLIFALGHPDVLALDDGGVRRSAGYLMGLGRSATRDELAARGGLWRPYRSVASLWLWRAP